MPRVDFYILSAAQIPLRLVCNLTSKAKSEGHGVHIQAKDQEQARQIDDNLWTFRDISFLPHTLVDDPEAAQHTITIGWPGMPPVQADVLIDLCHSEVPDSQNYARILELVGTERKQQARRLYKQYQQQGHELHTHHIDHSNG